MESIDADRHRELLKISREVLGHCVDRILAPRHRNPPPFDDLNQLIERAWGEVQLHFVEVADHLFMESKSLDESLRRVGLLGAQLELKEAVISRAYQIWKSSTEAFSKRVLKFLLELINTYLGSLSAVIDFAEAIKEFKEYLEFGIDPPFGGDPVFA